MEMSFGHPDSDYDLRGPVKEIACILNFESLDYFSAQFRKKIGKQPSDFR